MEIIGWLAFCAIVGYWAKERGRSPLLWGVLSIFISPLLAGVALAMMQDKRQAEDIAKSQMDTVQLRDRIALNENETNARISKVEEKVQHIENAAQNTVKINGTELSPLIEGTKICPYCGETIKQNAIKCRYCGAEIKEVHMVECPFCKELIRSDAVKCKYCRSDIPQSVEAGDETDDKQVD